MNDQPSRPTSPAAPALAADPTAAPAPAPAAPAPAGWDPTAALPAAAPPAAAEPSVVQPPVTPQGSAEWPAEPASAWGAPPAAPPGGFDGGQPPYGAQPGAPYGAQPDAAYGAQPAGAPYAAQPGMPYGAQSGPAYGAPPPDGYPGFPPPGASPYPPPGSGGTSGFAIASLIFGILGGILLSVIFGIVALVQIRKRGQTGRGMAIAGLTLSGCWVLLIIVGVTAAIISDSGGSSSSTAGSTGGSVSVTLLKPGDCINGIQTVGSVEDLPVISCALPHEGEVYATFNLPAGPWPGDSAVQKQAEKLCDAELKTYAPTPAATVQVLYLHPLQQSWSRDRGVTCVATDERGTTTGSVRD